MAATNSRGRNFRNDWGDQGGEHRGGNSGGKPKKNNGAAQGTDKNGAPWINGWNVSKDRGMVKVNIHPYKGSHEVKSGTGKRHIVMMATIHYLNSGMQDHYPVTYCPDTGYVRLDKHGWILNPKKGNMTRITK